ncbi:hypothetical protein GCM10023331_03610 [Algivirga pacifica]|uniref:Cadherin domain-containing protein n=2 Tax=Algivirga pacifica TaxID=1162670 RepID=A0ABP9CZ08_9BACT
MSITAILQTSKNKYSSDPNDMIAAFVDGECRGVTNISSTPYTDKGNLLFLLVNGRSFREQGVTLAYYDASTDQVSYINANVEFVDGTRLGTVDNPVILSAGAVNQAPTALTLSNTSILEGLPAQTLIGTFAVNDDATEGHTYSLQDSSVFRISGDQLITQAPLYYDTQEVYSITVTVDDGFGGFFTQDFNITVEEDPMLPGKGTPLAIADTIATHEDTAVTFYPLDNDQSEDGGLWISALGTPAIGNVTLQGSTVLHYTPSKDLYGQDSIYYEVTDIDGTVGSSWIIINVATANDIPVAEKDYYTTTEDQPISFDPLENDYAGDGGLAYQYMTTPILGEAIWNNNQITYTPYPDIHGVDSLTYTIGDADGDLHTASIIITVESSNDLPVASNDTLSVQEDESLSFYPLDNDVSADGALQLLSVEPSSLGTILINGTEVSFTPFSHVHGKDTLTYHIQDPDGDLTSAQIYLTVSAVNDVVQGYNDSYILLSNLTSVLTPLVNDSIPDGGGMLKEVSTGSYGTAVLLDAQHIQYTPSPDFIGKDTLTYSLSDVDGDQDNAFIFIEVKVNKDVPFLREDQFTLAEEQTMDLDVLDNDYINDLSSIGIGFTDPLYGTLTWNAIAYSFQYTPNPDFYGNDHFSYWVTDAAGNSDSSNVQLSITSVNDGVTATGEYVLLNEDESIQVDLLSNDYAGDGGLQLLYHGRPLHGTTLLEGNIVHYTPFPDFNGKDSLSYQLGDIDGDTATAYVIFEVLPANDPLQAFNDTIALIEDQAVTIVPIQNDIHVDGPIRLIDFTFPQYGSLIQVDDSTLRYTPFPHLYGTDGFDYTILEEDGSTATANVILLIEADDDEVIAQNDHYTPLEDSVYLFLPLQNDTYVDGGGHIAAISSSIKGNILLEDDTLIRYFPNDDFDGYDTLTYTLSDQDGSTAQASIFLEVPQAPLPEPITSITLLDDSISLQEDEVAVILPVLSNDTLLNVAAYTVNYSTPAHGQLQWDTQKQYFKYSPVSNYHGSDAFAYWLVSSDGVRDTAEVTLHVAAINDVVIAKGEQFILTEDDSISFVPLSNDLAADGGLALTMMHSPLHGQLQQKDDTLLTYIPNPHFYGLDSMIYTVSDQDGDKAQATALFTVTATNDLVYAQDDSVVLEEDKSVSIHILKNDLAPDGGITIDQFDLPYHGTLTLNGDSAILYTPYKNYYGEDMFSYIVKDNNGDKDTADVFIQVLPINDPIVTMDDLLTLHQGDSVVIFPLLNDSIPDGGETLLSVSTNNSENKTALLDEYSLYYKANSATITKDTLTYTVKDTDGNEATGNIFITITLDSIVTPPVEEVDTLQLHDDTYTLQEYTFSTLDVLSNDTVSSSSPWDISFTTPTNGTLRWSPDEANFLYRGTEGFSGTDTFLYSITLANGTKDTANVSITVQAINHPVVTSDTKRYLWEDQGDTINLNAYLYAPDGPAEILIISEPSHGQAYIFQDSLLRYTPNNNYYGNDILQYTVKDPQGDLDTATIQYTIYDTDDPVYAVNDQDTLNEDQSITLLPTQNDVHVDGPIRLIDFSFPQYGRLVQMDDTTLQYTPFADIYGTDQFNYTILEEDGSTANASVTLVIKATNDEVIAQNDYYTLMEDSAYTFLPLKNDIFPDGGGHISAISSSVKGNIRIESDTLVYYQPTSSFDGYDTLTYTLSDQDGSTGQAIIYLEISSDSIPDPITSITLVDDIIPLQEDDIAVVLPVLSNDTLLNVATYTVDYSTPAHGQLQWDTQNQYFRYTPVSNYYGEDFFTYFITSNDGVRDSSTVTLQISAMNDMVIAKGEQLLLQEDGAITFSPLSNDFAADGGLIVTAFSSPINGRLEQLNDSLLTYVPNPHFYGQDSITYTVSDQDGDEAQATASFTVTATNDLVYAEDDSVVLEEDKSVSIHILKNDLAPDGGLMIDQFDLPYHGTLTMNGDSIIQYTPYRNYYGEDTFSYTAKDRNGDKDTATIFIQVLPVNDPIVTMDDLLTLHQGDSVVIFPLLNDSIPDGGETLLSVSTNNSENKAALLDEYSLYYKANSTTITKDTLTYTVKDTDGSEAIGNIFITITTDSIVNPPVEKIDTPELKDDSFVLQEHTLAILEVINNDAIPSNMPWSISFTSPTNGTLRWNPDEAYFLYKGAEGFSGIDTFLYTVSLANGMKDTASVSITVKAINYPVIASDATRYLWEDQRDTLNLLPYIYAIDGVHEISIISAPNHGQAYVFQDSLLRYTPDNHYYGEDLLIYSVIDPQGDIDTATIQYTIYGTDDPVYAINDKDTLKEDQPHLLYPLVNDIGVDHGLYLLPNPQALHGHIEVQNDSTLYYLPSTNFNGSDQVLYYIADQDGDRDSAYIWLEILPVNDGIITNPDSAIVEYLQSIQLTPLVNDLIPDGGGRLNSVESLYGEATLLDNQTLYYYANGTFTGEDTLTYTVEDYDGSTATGSIYLKIYQEDTPEEPLDTLFQARDDHFSLLEDQGEVWMEIISNDTMNIPLKQIRIITPPAHGKAIILEDQLRYASDADYYGKDSLEYLLMSDDKKESNAWVYIDIASVNDPLEVVDDYLTVKQEKSVSFDPLKNDIIEDGLYDIFISRNPTNGVFYWNDKDEIEYTPLTGFAGEDSLEYTVEDMDGSLGVGMVYITVEEKGNKKNVASSLVLTPDDNNINDFLLISKEGELLVDEYDLYVYNARGQEVFSVKNYDGKWDGKHNGKYLSNGVYFYILVGEEEEIKGSFYIKQNQGKN